MRKSVFLVFCMVGFLAHAQKNTIPASFTQASELTPIAYAAQEDRVSKTLSQWNQIQPIGINQFREENKKDQPIYFEVYPNPAHNWLGCDFPANRDIRFIRILNVVGEVVGIYHRWDRQFYIGHLQSGLYQIQVVQNDFMAHSTAFFKR